MKTTDRLFSGAMLLAGLYLCTHTVHAQNATWEPSPLIGASLNDPANWVPTVVPTGIATFDVTSQIGQTPATTASITFGEILFTSTASHYNFAIVGGNTLTINGAGIVNDSPISQNFVVVSAPSMLLFENNSTAGNNTTFGNRGGAILFSDHSTAGSGKL